MIEILLFAALSGWAGFYLGECSCSEDVSALTRDLEFLEQEIEERRAPQEFPCDTLIDVCLQVQTAQEQEN